MLLSQHDCSRRRFVTSVLKPLSCGGLLASTPVDSAARDSRQLSNLHTNDDLRRYLDYVATRNRISQLLKKSGDSKIGVFWFVQEPAREPELLGSYVYLQQGKRYGLFVDGPDDHVSGWSLVGQIIRQFRDPSLHDSGPMDWPRGRVLFNMATKHFEVGLTKQLLTLQSPQFQTQILNYFRLPREATVFSADPHYAETRFTLAEHGSDERSL
jgi:hypothetical protein